MEDTASRGSFTHLNACAELRDEMVNQQTEVKTGEVKIERRGEGQQSEG